MDDGEELRHKRTVTINHTPKVHVYHASSSHIGDALVDNVDKRERCCTTDECVLL